jgi:hypothetical protein
MIEYEAAAAESPLQREGIEITLEKAAGIWMNQNVSKQYRGRSARKTSAARKDVVARRSKEFRSEYAECVESIAQNGTDNRCSFIV